MTTYITRRLIQTFIVAFSLSFVIYFLLTLMPGDPIDLLLSSNPHIKPEDVARLRELHGLDKPVLVRYYNWLSDIMRGDLGYSRTYNLPTTDILFPRMINTFILSSIAIIFSLVIAIPLGVVAALKSGSRFDYAVNLFAFAGISMPVFWLAILLIIIFSVQLGWLPAGGTFTVGKQLTGFAAVVDRLQYILLPAFTLSLVQIGQFVRYTRSSMMEAMRHDFIRTARAKGLSPARVIFLHGFRNALIPIVTIVAISFSFIFSGALITETIFSYQGVGKLIYDSIIANDFNVAMIALMITLFSILIFNLIADILYAVVDPRISYS